MTDPNDPYHTLDDSQELKFGESVAALASGMVLNSKYELIEQIGRGGMGVVWKAKDRVGDRLVALKFVPRNLQRFVSEMQRVRDMFGKVHALNHQAICPLYRLEDGGGQIGHYPFTFTIFYWICKKYEMIFEIFGMNNPPIGLIAFTISSLTGLTIINYRLVWKFANSCITRPTEHQEILLQYLGLNLPRQFKKIFNQM